MAYKVELKRGVASQDSCFKALTTFGQLKESASLHSLVTTFALE